MDADDRLLTVREVADAMRVSHMTVYRLIKSGELLALRVGRNFRIRQSDLDRFFDAQTVIVVAEEPEHREQADSPADQTGEAGA